MPLQVNGTTISWYVVIFVCTCIFYGGISYWKIEVLEKTIEELKEQQYKNEKRFNEFKDRIFERQLEYRNGLGEG